MSLVFSKYHGGGNDFIIIDDRSLAFACSDMSLISSLCSRRFGIGADGLILLQPSNLADFRFRIFNADGSEAALCGNGLCCFIAYLRDLGFVKPIFHIETEKEILQCSFEGDRVSVKLPAPKILHWELYLEEEQDRFFILDTGVPHAVCLVEELKEYPVDVVGRRIRFHPAFASIGGVNVNFVKVEGDDTIRIRTYEKGVEGETYSCGTGAAAAAIVANQLGLKTSPIRVIPRSGESFEFFLEDTTVEKEVTMLACTSFVFTGNCNQVTFSI